MEARKALFKLYHTKRPYDFGLDYDALARKTENYVSADIQLIVNTASRQALRLQSKITMALLEQAIEETHPSLSLAELARYEKIKAQMEGKASHTDRRPEIGFN